MFGHTHENYAARIFVQAFSVVIFAISASTTFGFFYEFFPEILPSSVSGEFLGRLLSGIMGVSLFDLAALYWLNTYLRNAETSEQRAVALLMVIVTFIGGASASVAHLGLTAGKEMVLAASLRETVGTIAVAVVIIGVVANFGATLMYTRFSLENQELVRNANRRDRLSDAQYKQSKILDEEVSQMVETRLTEEAKGLADLQAGRIVGEYMRQEQAKFSDPVVNDTAVEDTVVDVPLFSDELEDFGGGDIGDGATGLEDDTFGGFKFSKPPKV